MTILPILESLVASSQKFSSVTSSRLFFLKMKYFQSYLQTMCPNHSFIGKEWTTIFFLLLTTWLLTVITKHIPLTTYPTYNISHLQAYLDKVLSNLILVSDNIRLTNSFKYLPNLLKATSLSKDIYILILILISTLKKYHEFKMHCQIVIRWS